jgi:hypothetical protein
MKNPFKTDLPEFFEWVDPEQERKDNKNAVITGWGLGLGVALWVLFGVLGSGIAGFLLFFICWFGSYMLTED